MLRAVVVRLVAGYIWLVGRTTRWEVHGQAHLDQVVARDGSFICSVWHGRLFLTPMLGRGLRERVAMISANRDGELIAETVALFDVRAVRGSTYDKAKQRDKGGAQAFAGAQEELETGRVLICITPDGPRGPLMRAQPGIAHLSVVTGSPVLPVSFSARWGWRLSNWDRFLLPVPFGRGAVVYGTPIDPPASGEPEAIEVMRHEIETATTVATQEADRLCGRKPLVPAPWAAEGAAALPGRQAGGH